MPAPTALNVQLDGTEYSRYERSFDTITATVTATGGGSYTDVPITLELVKARLSRTAVAGSLDLTLTGVSDQTEVVGELVLNDMVDQDLISLVRHGRYFVRARYDATSATAEIGSGANGTIEITLPEGADGNDWTIEVVVPGGTSALTTSIAGTDITVSLAVSGGVPITAQNTGILVLSSLQGQGLACTVSGNGTASFSVAEGPTSFTGGTDEVIGESDDFNIRIVTVSRLKSDYLFGIDLKATNVLQAKFPPQSITGVTILEISEGHPKGLQSLSYTVTPAYVNAAATIGSGANGSIIVTPNNTLSGAAGNTYSVAVVVPGGTSDLSVTLIGLVLTISLATVGGVPTTHNSAANIAAAISEHASFIANASGNGTGLFSVAIASTPFVGGVTTTARFLSWGGGPSVAITGPGTYILPIGTSGMSSCAAGIKGAGKHYIIVRVSSPSLMPSTSISESLLIEAQTMDETTLGRYLDEAIAYLENDLLAVHLEPTNVVTDRDPTTIQYTSGIRSGVPIFEDVDFDFIVSPLTYFIPAVAGRWIEIQTPYPSLLRVDSLFGAIADTRVITIDLSWIEHSEKGGLIQLVPFNQETAFDFVGLIWVNALRGATELPNFWHFNMIVGLRSTPAEIQEFIGKYAGINALTAASLAFRPGIGSLSLSKDGVSQSTSYNTQAQYGAYTGAITSYKEWIEDKTKHIRAKYRSLNMIVV